MRRSGQPSLPSAMTCCFFDSFKTLLMPTQPTRLHRDSMSGTSLPLAGFQVIIIGRFWVITEAKKTKSIQETQPMTRFSSIFSQLLQLFPRLEFEQLLVLRPVAPLT